MAAGSVGQSEPKAVTRDDVARYAGVSSAVVSYVVNDGPRPVAAATAARVRAAIDLLGYRPNVAARALKVGSSRLLALVVPDSSNPFFAEFALEMEKVATERGLALLVANSNADTALEARLLADLAARQVDGLIVSGAAGPPPHGGGSRISTPIVYIDCALPAPGHRTLGADVFDGARQAVEHLLVVHRHPTVAMVIGVGAGSTTDQREAGWQQALEDADCPPGPVVRVPFTRNGGYMAGLRLFRSRPLPDAVFTSNDIQALGLMRAAHELGIQVPDEVAVVAFDCTQESEYSWPPLTSARQPIKVMAEAAVSTVLDTTRAPSHQVFPMDLVIRRSCGCANTAPHRPDRARKGS
jgi:LacI family transcriptional regulator